MIKSVVRNIAALFTGEVIARICHFVAVVYIARLFGAAGFGAINFSLAILSYFLMVTNLGLGELGVREVSRNRDIKDVAETVISMRLGIAAISFIAICVIAFFGKKASATTYLVVAYGMTIFPYALSLEWVFRGVMKMKYNAYGRVINAMLYLALVFIFVRSIQDILKVAFITMTCDMISCVFYYVNYSRKFGAIKLHLDPKRWFEMGRISAQLFVSSAMLTAYLNFGMVILGFLKGDKDVGIYGAASKLIFFVYALSDLFVAATYPVMSRLYHESSDKFASFMRHCIKLTLLAGLPIAIGGTILGPKIIQLVYGKAYSASGVVFMILSWFAAVNLSGFAASYSLVSSDRQGAYLKIMVSAAIFNLLLNLTVVPFAGYVGTAAVLLATETLILVASLAVIASFIKLPDLSVFARPLGAALVMGITLLVLIRLNVLLLIPIAFVVYCGALFMFGGISKDEISKIRGAFA
jgi:O-antigen/teichoic acid export membrane protein